MLPGLVVEEVFGPGLRFVVEEVAQHNGVGVLVEGSEGIVLVELICAEGRDVRGREGDIGVVYGH